MVNFCETSGDEYSGYFDGHETINLNSPNKNGQVVTCPFEILHKPGIYFVRDTFVLTVLLTSDISSRMSIASSAMTCER